MPEAQQITPRIIVTTDFSKESETAFYHALTAAVKRQARLTLLHTGSESRGSVPWERFPGVRDTLTAWKLLEPDSPRSAVADDLNVGVAKMAMRDDDPRQGITDYLRKHPTDLLIMATRGRRGLARLFNPSIAESVSYRTKSHTLMLPRHGKHLIDPATGASSLKKVLCALDPLGDPRPAIAFLGRWLPALSDDTVDVTFLDTGDGEAEGIIFPNVKGINWHTLKRTGDVVEALLSEANAIAPELIVMNSACRLNLMGRLRGSRIDRVLKTLRLPLLSVPRQ